MLDTLDTIFCNTTGQNVEKKKNPAPLCVKYRTTTSFRHLSRKTLCFTFTHWTLCAVDFWIWTNAVWEPVLMKVTDQQGDPWVKWSWSEIVQLPGVFSIPKTSSPQWVVAMTQAILTAPTFSSQKTWNKWLCSGQAAGCLSGFQQERQTAVVQSPWMSHLDIWHMRKDLQNRIVLVWSERWKIQHMSPVSQRWKLLLNVGWVMWLIYQAAGYTILSLDKDKCSNHKRLNCCFARCCLVS